MLNRILETTKPFPILYALATLTISFYTSLFNLFFFWIPQKPIPPKAPTKNIMTQLIRSEHSDSRGIAFAGQILAWMDICSGIAARKHSGSQCVTVAIDAVHFLNPVRVNQICILRASVNRAWGTSMEVGVSVESEDMLTGETVFCCHGYFTFVTVGKVLVPPVLPTSMRDRRRFHEAQERRNNRLLKPRVAPKPCLPQDPTDIQAGNEIETLNRRHGSFTQTTNRKVFFKSLPCSESYTQVTEIVFPEHCNSLGITFGGQIMKWMVYCASISANRHVRSNMLVASIDSVTFLHPSRQVFKNN